MEDRHLMMCFATGILIEGRGLLHRPAETLFNGFDRGQHRAALPSFPMAFMRRKGVVFDLTLEAAGCHLAHILVIFLPAVMLGAA